MVKTMDSNKSNSKASKVTGKEAGKEPSKVTTKVTLKSPTLPSKSTTPLSNLDLADDTEYGDFILSGQSLVGQSFERVTIERSLFKLVRCSALNLAKSKLVDIRFETCDLSNSEFEDGKFTRVEMTDCKITGMHVTDTDIGDLLLQSCTGELVQFHDSVFKRVVFQGCQLRGADFRYCN